MPGPTGESQRAALPRPRRVRLHQPVEFSAGDLPRPGRSGARRRQRAWSPSPPSRRRWSRPRRCACCTRPACRRARCISCRATARSARRWWPIARVAGVAFTGSTEVGACINRALAAKDGPIVPLIAETGGINAMIVDATALPEQVTDDVMTSAFRSAGQRCSALRLLCVQEDVADRMIEMIAGAARELALGDPRDPATHVGPVIDAEAKDAARPLDRRVWQAQGRVLFRWDAGRALPARGPIRAAGDHRARSRRRPAGGGVRADPARGALARRRTRRAARRHRRQRHRPHARHPYPHRRHRRPHRGAACAAAMSTSTAA